MVTWRYWIHSSCLFIPTVAVASRVRIIYVGINFTAFRNMSPPMALRGHFCYTSVGDLLHPSNSFIDRLILNTWYLQSKTDKASEFEKQQLIACAIRLKSRCLQNNFKRKKIQFSTDLSKTYGCPWSTAIKLQCFLNKHQILSCIVSKSMLQLNFFCLINAYY